MTALRYERGLMEGEQGLFAVRISMRNGIPVAVLTGEHYDAGPVNVALSKATMDSKESILRGESPVYLVRDSVVRLAVDAKLRALRDGLSSCHDGENGIPCGECPVCIAAEDYAFTRIILGSTELPKCGERLRKALSCMIGSVRVDAPWETAMDDEEVDKVFKELGVEPKKG